MATRKRWKNLARRALRSIVTLKGSPEAIALGTAIGMVIAFTPTIGFQMMLGAAIATLVRASRPAAMIPAWITNPVTIPPIFAFTYWLGKLIWRGPSVSEVYRQLDAVAKALEKFSWYEFHNQFAVFLRAGVDVYVCLMIGGLIVGGILGAASYPVVLRAVRASRTQVEQARMRRAARRAKLRESLSNTTGIEQARRLPRPGTSDQEPSGKRGRT
jgi:uncharacterized protein (DUF2062 family)